MRRKHIVLVWVCVSIPFVALLTFLLCPTPEARYEVVFLPDLNGVSVSPGAINDHGQVAGVVQGSAQQCRLVVWDPNSGLRDLGPCEDPWSCGRLRINNAGQIAWGTVDPNGGNHAFLLDPNGVRHILRPPSGERIWVNDLNNRGQIVGYFSRDGVPLRGFLWDKTSGMRDLAMLGNVESVATGINDRGQIVGSYARHRAGPHTVFLWDPNAGIQDLGSTRTFAVRTCRINNRGFVVGRFGTSGDKNLLSTWTEESGLQRLCPDRMTSAQVNGLNDADRVLVCTSQRRFMLREFCTLSHIDSYLWDPDEGFREIGRHLGRRDVFEFFATDINNRGQIVGPLRLRKHPNPFGVVLTPIGGANP